MPDILKRYIKPPSSNLFDIKKLRKQDRFDPLFYRPGKHASFFGSVSSHKLGDLAEPGGIQVSKSKKNWTKYKYLEVSGADSETGKVLKLKEFTANELPSRAKWIVREGMVLIPNHRNSIAAGRSPVLITEELDGIVVTSRFIPLFCKVPSAYVFHILNLDFMKEKLLTTVTGSSSTEIKWNIISDIPVPVPPNKDYDTFLADVMELESRIDKYLQLLEERRNELKNKFTELFE